MHAIVRLASVSLAVFAIQGSASTCTAVSGTYINPLIELYTSEGCSSCPPADQWLSSLRNQPPGQSHIVPLALHVDYWDYIGWKDRFARPEFAIRQREMAAVGRSSVVYTPQIAIQGRDNRAWTNETRFKNTVASLQRLPAKAHIQLQLHDAAVNSLQVTTRIQTAETGPLVYYVALEENNLQSAVNAGENRNAVLKHDFVVRQWLGPFKLSNQNTQGVIAEGAVTEATHRIAYQADWKKPDLQVVVFVQKRSQRRSVTSAQQSYV